MDSKMKWASFWVGGWLFATIAQTIFTFMATTDPRIDLKAMLVLLALFCVGFALAVGNFVIKAIKFSRKSAHHI
jgi:hypothetical protein